MKEDELKKYFDLYTCCWRFFKKYSNPVDDDRFWDSFVEEAGNIMEKFRKSELAKKIVLATIDEIEEIYKSKKGEQL